MSFDRPFRAMKSLAVPAAVTLALLSPVAILLPARIQAAQQGDAPSSSKSDTLKIAAAQTSAAAGNSVNVDQFKPVQSSPAQSKSIATRTIEKAKEVAKSAGDIFSRVPCLPPKGGIQPMGSLPHVAGKLASGKPVVIVAFGSSSTSRVTVRRRRISPTPTGWRRNCIDNIRALRSPCSIAASAEKMRRK